jgi:hypothetical protein
VDTARPHRGKAGACLARQGIEITADTAIDVGVYGNNWGSALLWNTVGSIGGEALFNSVAAGVKKGWRRARDAVESLRVPRRVDDFVELAIVNLSRQERLLQQSTRNSVAPDENVFFLERELTRQGFTVTKVPAGAPDSAIRQALNTTGARFVTKNFKDFKGLEGVIRVSDKVPLIQQLNTTLNSLEAARINPELFLRMRQVPASGINLGLVNPPR